MARFSAFEDERLIAEVQKYPVLYNYEDENYKNFAIKENAWKEVAVSVGKNGEDCKKRWKGIKDTYFRNKKKMKLGTGSSALDKPSKWNLFRLLTFLDKIKHQRDSRNTLDEPAGSDDTQESQHVEATEGLGDTDIEEVCSPVFQSEEENRLGLKKKIEDSGSLTSGSRCSTPLSNPKKSRKQDTKDAFLMGYEERALKRLKLLETIQSKQLEEREDDVDLFMKSISLTVKKLPPELINEAKIGILTLLARLEAKASSIKSNQPSFLTLPDNNLSNNNIPYTSEPYSASSIAINTQENSQNYNQYSVNQFDASRQPSKVVVHETHILQPSSSVPSTSSPIYSNRSYRSFLHSNPPKSVCTSDVDASPPIPIDVNRSDVSQPFSSVITSPLNQTHFSGLSKPPRQLSDVDAGFLIDPNISTNTQSYQISPDSENGDIQML